MTKQEVIEKMEYFSELVEKEQKLQEELLSLQMYGSDPNVIREKLQRHDEIIKEIEDIRFNRVIPLLKEIADFVASRQGEVELPDLGRAFSVEL